MEKKLNWKLCFITKPNGHICVLCLVQHIEGWIICRGSLCSLKDVKDKVKNEIACYKCLKMSVLWGRWCSSSKFQSKVKGKKLIVFCHRNGSKFSPPIFYHAHGFQQRLKLSFPIGNGNDEIQFSDNVKILIKLIYPLWPIFKRFEHQLI